MVTKPKNAVHKNMYAFVGFITISK